MCKVREFVIKNEFGIHARPATRFVQIASDYESEVSVQNLTSGATANGRSIMSMLTLAAAKGHVIKLEIDGSDEDQLMLALAELIESGFEE